ncbi:DNA mismatch repair protein Msh3-like isoform X2 [Ptychodera flava]|uniref:DNA mismatch repair protein Msh3-like isoform X2 n=1 Tax=Ptychodera flava TaxID=63121 RepID=UPI00396A07A0
MPKPNLGKLRTASGGDGKGKQGQANMTQVTLSRFFSPSAGQKKGSDPKRGSNNDSDSPANAKSATKGPIKTVKVQSPFRKRSINEARGDDDLQSPLGKRAKVETENKSDPELEATQSTSNKVNISNTTLSRLSNFSANNKRPGKDVEATATSELADQRDIQKSSHHHGNKQPSPSAACGNSSPEVDHTRNGDDEVMICDQKELKTSEDKAAKSKFHGLFGFEAKDRGKTKAENERTGAKASRSKSKYTPLEQQFMEIKEQYPNAVLLVECGYKYRFFGEDAEIASKELNIYCHLDHNFMTASIPVHRLFVHVRRLVSAGYKVGVVKQTETAALKAAGDNRSAPFSRKLSALYTKSTLIGEDVDPSSSDMEVSDTSTDSNYLMCVMETVATATKPDEVQLGLVAVQPATGDIIYDEFIDSGTRSELETRIGHIQPVELLLPSELSEKTERIVKSITASSFRKEDRIRVERMEDQVFQYISAFKLVSDFYNSASQQMSSKEGCKLQEMVNLPKAAICCLAALIKYLQEFGLDKVLKLTSNVQPFSAHARHMKLNACTLKNLEIFRNETDGGSKGTLFSVLDHTSTRFGQRLLKKWISQPLMNSSEIEKRQEAVGEIIESSSPVINQIKALLSKMPDIEKGLCSIYHKKSSTTEFSSVCKTLNRLAMELQNMHGLVEQGITSTLLKTSLEEIPALLDDVQTFTNAISEKAAKDGDKTNLFVNESDYPAICERKAEIEKVKEDIVTHRREVRLTLKNPSLDYVTVSGQEYLIEVKNAHLRLVPDDWMKISYTKAVSRYHSPFIMASYKTLCQLREQLQIDCNNAWMDFLESFGEHYHSYRNAIQLLATIDCLYSLATVAKQDGYCRPTVVDQSGTLLIEDGRHPVVDLLLGEQKQYVPNSTHMEIQGKQCMIITGPNMGGKSSYIKQVAMIALMAQIGSYVPAKTATLGVFDAIYTRMGASDNICHGDSTFMVELQEASEILNRATDKSLVILDELGRGTSTYDGMAIAYATLHYIVQELKCLTLFVTHYPMLAELEKTFPSSVGNYHMSFLVHDQDDEEAEDVDVITFLYQLVPGVAARSYGLNVAKLADIPTGIVQVAAEKSREFEKAVMAKRDDLSKFFEVWKSNEDTVKSLLSKRDIIEDGDKD